MKIFLLLISLTLLASCSFFSSNKKEDPLILPPNFSEMPDPDNPEQPTQKGKQENVEKLKELLLNSD